MLKHFAGHLLLPVSIALALASCQQPSATTTAPSPSVVASASPTESPKASASPTTSESPKADAAPSSSKTKDIDAIIKENAEYKEMYEATDGIKYIGLVETETCKALDSGVPFPTLIDALEKEFDKQGSSIPADKLAKLKEYTGFVVGASVVISCPQHKDKIK
jgi:hypothetical protein